jgi:hypothetical protein
MIGIAELFTKEITVIPSENWTHDLLQEILLPSPLFSSKKIDLSLPSPAGFFFAIQAWTGRAKTRRSMRRVAARGNRSRFRLLPRLAKYCPCRLRIG